MVLSLKSNIKIKPAQLERTPVKKKWFKPTPDKTVYRYTL